jgi:hypothetical protein
VSFSLKSLPRCLRLLSARLWPAAASAEQKKKTLAAGAFLAVFLIALTAYLIGGRERMHCVIFFPETAAEELSGEPRSIYRQDTLSANIQALVNEMVLGPMDIRHANMFPRTTRVRSVFVRDGAAYIDFSEEVIFLGSENKTSFEELMSAVNRTVLFNFHTISRIVITIGGQEPGSPPYRPKKQ